jgi:hypothetical protein
MQVALTQLQVLGISIRERRRKDSLSKFKDERNKHEGHMQTKSFPRIGFPEVDVWNMIEKNESGNEE